MTTPFKTLVQHEMNRLQTLVTNPQAPALYAMPGYRYTTRKAILVSRRKPSTYSGLLSFTRVLRLFLF